MGSLRAAANAEGTAALVFEGPGESNGYGFSRPFGVYGSISGAPATNALSGNVGVEESGRDVYPQVAIDSAGDAMALWMGWPTTAEHGVSIAYRDHAGVGWTAPASIFCCSNLIGSYRPALDSAGNGYVVLWGGENEHHENKGVIFEYASRSALKSGSGWGPAQHLDAGEPGEPQEPREARIAVDSAGDATAVWIAQDPASGHDTIYAAYRPAGDATSFGAPVKAYVAPGSGEISGDEISVAPAGEAVIAWTTCAQAGCGEHAVQARTRASADGAFGALETVGEATEGMGGLTLADDPQGEVLLGWRENASNAIFASTHTSPPPSEGGGEEGGGKGSGSGDGTKTPTPLSNPSVPLLAFPAMFGKVNGNHATLPLRCVGPANCTGTVSLRNLAPPGTIFARRGKKSRKAKAVVYATGSFSIAAGRTMPVTLHMTKVGKSVFRHHRSLPAYATTTLSDGQRSTHKITLKR